MKCLTQIVESDPVVLARTDMQLGVHHSFLDQSTAVREAAVDLVGKFVLSRPELIDKYYTMLSARILDTGVSVRKRVIKVFEGFRMNGSINSVLIIFDIVDYERYLHRVP